MGSELPFGKKEINVSSIFEDGTAVHDTISGLTATSKRGESGDWQSDGDCFVGKKID